MSAPCRDGQVTELIQSSDCTRKGHHSRYRRFFSAAAWRLDTLSCLLARMLVRVFVPSGVIERAVDDTLCRKRGLTVYGTGMHHDPVGKRPDQMFTSTCLDWDARTILAYYACRWAIEAELCRNRPGDVRIDHREWAPEHISPVKSPAISLHPPKPRIGTSFAFGITDNQYEIVRGGGSCSRLVNPCWQSSPPI